MGVNEFRSSVDEVGWAATIYINSKLRLSHIQRLLADYVMAEQLREALVACQNYFKHRTTPKVLLELLGLFDLVFACLPCHSTERSEDWNLYKKIAVRDANHFLAHAPKCGMTFFNDYYHASALILNFNPTQGRLLIAPARHSANKFASALAYSQF